MKNPPRMRKRGAIWYFRDRTGGHDRLISTYKRDKSEAIEAAVTIRAQILRERADRKMAAAMIRITKEYARQDLSKENLRDRLAELERMTAVNVFPVIDALIPAPPLSPAV